MNFSGFFSKSGQILGITCALLAVAATQAVAQSVTVAIGSGSAAPGTVVTLPVTITASGSAQPSDIEWTTGYSSSDISSVSVQAGASAIAAAKSVTCSSIAGSTRCVVTGTNSNIIGNGTLATVTFTVASGSLHTSTPIPLSGVVASSGPGSSIAGIGVAGTITIVQPVQPTLTALTCTPASLNPGGVSACTVTLSSAALTGGFAVALSSNDALLTVPASVTVAAGASSAGFSASVAATVPTSQTAIVTASASSVVKTFSLNIAASTWTITGGVGTAGSGATIALTGTSTATTTANASGAYTFSGLANGSYTITPTLTGYTFSPVSVAVTINGANVTAATFTATAQTWTITGGVGTAGSGATIALTGTSTATTTANASGAYTFSGLANGSYTITPSLTGYTFSPVSVAVTINGANVTAANFTEQATLGPITVDASLSTDRSTESTSISVPALSSVSGNELWLAFIAAGDRTRKLTSPTVTGVSGGGLTWVLVTRTNVQKGDAEIWRAFASTALTGVSIKATLSQSVPASMTVMSFMGVNTTGTGGAGAIGATGSGNAASGAPSATLIATHSGSLVIGVGSDTKAALARTVGTGQTLVHQYLASTTDTYWVQNLSSATASSGATITINDSAPTSDPFNLAIVEILAGQATGTQMTGLVTLAPVSAAKVANLTNSVAPLAPLVLAIITTGEAGDACSPGGLASLLGTGLTGGQTESSTASPLPTQLAGIQVMINGVPAPMLLASDSQINFQCPALPQGTAMEIQVESVNGVMMSSLQTVMQAAVPLVFQLDAGGRGYVTIGGTNEVATATGGIPSRPAKRGEVLNIHAAGLGEVVNGVDAGTVAPLNRPVPTKAQIKLVLGGIEMDPEFAGLTPGTVGLYQVNVLVPAEAPTGSAVPLYLKMTMPDGTIFRSNTVTVAITDAAGQ